MIKLSFLRALKVKVCSLVRMEDFQILLSNLLSRGYIEMKKDPFGVLKKEGEKREIASYTCHSLWAFEGADVLKVARFRF